MLQETTRLLMNKKKNKTVLGLVPFIGLLACYVWK